MPGNCWSQKYSDLLQIHGIDLREKSCKVVPLVEEWAKYRCYCLCSQTNKKKRFSSVCFVCQISQERRTKTACERRCSGENSCIISTYPQLFEVHWIKSHLHYCSRHKEELKCSKDDRFSRKKTVFSVESHILSCRTWRTAQRMILQVARDARSCVL